MNSPSHEKSLDLRLKFTFELAGICALLGWTVLGMVKPKTWLDRSLDFTGWLKMELVCFNIATSMGLLRAISHGKSDFFAYVGDISGTTGRSTHG